MTEAEKKNSELETVCGVLLDELRKHGNKLAVAESCTGGLIAASLVSHSGCSDCFSGGAVVYSNELKHAILGVPCDIFDKYGAVSEECIGAMLRGTLEHLNCDCAIAVSGIAGPGGGLPGKPVGTVYIGAALKSEQKILRLELTGGRNSVRVQAACKAVELTIDLIKEFYHE